MVQLSSLREELFSIIGMGLKRHSAEGVWYTTTAGTGRETSRLPLFFGVLFIIGHSTLITGNELGQW
jgi:hypothetical protein